MFCFGCATPNKALDIMKLVLHFSTLSSQTEYVKRESIVLIKEFMVQI